MVKIHDPQMLGILAAAYNDASQGRMPEAEQIVRTGIFNMEDIAKEYLAELEKVLNAGRACYTTKLYRDVLKNALDV